MLGHASFEGEGVGLFMVSRVAKDDAAGSGGDVVVSLHPGAGAAAAPFSVAGVCAMRKEMSRLSSGPPLCMPLPELWIYNNTARGRFIICVGAANDNDIVR